MGMVKVVTNAPPGNMLATCRETDGSVAECYLGRSTECSACSEWHPRTPCSSDEVLHAVIPEPKEIGS